MKVKVVFYFKISVQMIHDYQDDNIYKYQQTKALIWVKCLFLSFYSYSFILLGRNRKSCRNDQFHNYHHMTLTYAW